MANRTKRTPKKEVEFFKAIIEHGGNVTRACAAVNYTRSRVYQWRQDDPDFARQFEEAVQRGAEALEDECRRRAFDGTTRPVFYQGKKCGGIQEYSDTLAIFLLKGAMPHKYRDRLTVDFSRATKQQIADALAEMSDAEFSRAVKDRKRKDAG